MTSRKTQKNRTIRHLTEVIELLEERVRLLDEKARFLEIVADEIEEENEHLELFIERLRRRFGFWRRFKNHVSKLFKKTT